MKSLFRAFIDKPVEDLQELVKTLRKAEQTDIPVIVYPDAGELINQRLMRMKMQAQVAEIRKDPKNHPLRKNLLKTELLPYQLDGIAFAVGAGRSVQ